MYIWQKINCYNIGILLFLLLPFTALAQTDELKVALNIYPGNVGYYLMQTKLEKDQPTFLEKRMKETGGKVTIIPAKDYVVSIQAFVGGQYDAISITTTDYLLMCADVGAKASFVMITDYSNGNDGIVLPKGWNLNQMKGKTIAGDKLSCMELLSQRWLELNGKPKDYLVFKNHTCEETPQLFLSTVGTKDAMACLTWNPGITRLLETGKAELVFSTKNTPGEMIDGFAIRSAAIKDREKSIQALMDAYYDAMAYFTDPKTHDRALQAIAPQWGFSSEEIPLLAKIMDNQFFFTTKEESLSFMESKQLQRTKNIALDFFKDSKALKSKNPDSLDITLDPQFLKK